MPFFSTSEVANDVATSNTKPPGNGEYLLLKNQILFPYVNLDLPAQFMGVGLSTFTTLYW